jgi:transposase
VDRETFAQEVQAVCDCYHAAPAVAAQGGHTISTDEKPMQVLERAHPGLPLRPGHVERREFEYVRHGTQCLIANLDVPTGRVVAPSLGPTRTEEDFVAHIAQTVATDPDAAWIFIVDNLNTHRSAGLVAWVAQACGIATDLGVKEKRGILESLPTRGTFLSDPDHRIRFVYLPPHTSWLNQVEIWLGTLTRLVLQRANHACAAALRHQVLAFIAHYNRTMAKPINWTYTGRVTPPAQVAAPSLTDAQAA